MISRMKTPQSGIFALGTTSHAYLEFDLKAEAEALSLVTAVASLREPRTTMGGMNLVAGFRPELWQRLSPDDAPPGVAGFNQDLVGAEGYVMPATQHDLVLWMSASEYDVIFDEARQAISSLSPFASIRAETSSWPYHHDRDLTGFIDGTENPSLLEAPEVALVADAGKLGLRLAQPRGRALQVVDVGVGFALAEKRLALQ